MVVAAVLAMGALQRADIREFRVDTRADIQEFRIAVRADFQGINDRIDRVNDRMDQYFTVTHSGHFERIKRTSLLGSAGHGPGCWT